MEELQVPAKFTFVTGVGLCLQNMAFLTSRPRDLLSFIQHESLEIVCSLEVTSCSQFDIGIIPKLVNSRPFEMH